MSEDDKWAPKEMQSSELAWSDRTGPQKVLHVTVQFLKAVVVIGLLYVFIVSLGVMGNAFQIIGGPTAGRTFRNSKIFDNPFAGCSLGILATVLVQSSSTSTSIIISMTAAMLMEPENAIYMIMGANVGTSVTNTIVSLSHVGDKDEYRRAFAGATVHDCFNLLTVSFMLPLEYFTHVLYRIGNGIVTAAGIEEDQQKAAKVDFIKKITSPITQRIVQLDKKLVTKVAEAGSQEELDDLLAQSMIKNSRTTINHMFLDTPMSDSLAGWLLLVVSLVMLSTTLILLVKLLQTIFQGRAAIWMKGLLNLQFRTIPFLADYVLLVFGIGITILMQSSSVTTSTLTPLVGIGLIRLEKMYPYTVGANIGTTVTGILSALSGSNVATGMTVAMAHLFFNIIGTVVWFPIPCMRAVPIAMAKALGNVAADWRWFPVAYIFIVFAVIPGALLGLSLLHWAALVFVGLPCILLIIAASCVFACRAHTPHLLPGVLKKDYRWMPPSARIHDGPAAVAEKEGPAVAPGSADVRGTGQWQLAPAAYGVGWYVLLALAVALPNAKWADMKYAEFDSREHIGMGYSTACSVMFMEDVDWALEPSTGDALARHLEDCTADLEEQCSASGGRLSATPGGNSVYENSWKGCSNATTGQWEEKCLTITGCGGLHEEQCANVSRAVERPYSITYGSGAKWSKAAGGSPYCIPVGSLCEDVDRVTAAGVLGAVGAALAGLGLLAILSYCFLGGGGSSRRRALVAAGLALSAAWAALLASWLLFHHALGHVTTCYVQADHNNGIVAATGPLGDIVNPGGSYSYYCVVGAWALLTPVMLAAWARAAAELRGGGHAGPNGATEAAAAAAAAAPKGQDAEAAAGAQAGFCAPTGPSIEAAPCGALGSPGANGSHAGAIGPDQVHVQVGADRHNASGVGPEPEQPLGAPDALGVLFAPSSGAGSPPGDAAGADAGRGVDRRTIHCLCNGVPICVPRTR